MQAYGYAGSLAGLPDPEMDRQFYEGVPARRLAAWMIDLLITLLIGVPAAVMFGLMTLGFGFALFPFLVATVGFVYRVATIAGGSATWGMRAMGIELRRADGSRFDFAAAIMHTALYTISFGVVVLQIVSCVSMVASRYGQGLPDVILRTTAINRPAD
ncbi:MAG: RDD family protein [Amaricoccus sp.]|uniref:RDD family protein n=1 Tax=Amaricoccus sp. TaxID=1872485 RepID=UPI003314E401